MFVFIKLHITAQSGPVTIEPIDSHYMPLILVLVLLMPRGFKGSIILITITSDQTRQRGRVCVFIELHITA